MAGSLLAKPNAWMSIRAGADVGVWATGEYSGIESGTPILAFCSTTKTIDDEETRSNAANFFERKLLERCSHRAEGSIAAPDAVCTQGFWINDLLRPDN